MLIIIYFSRPTLNRIFSINVLDNSSLWSVYFTRLFIFLNLKPLLTPVIFSYRHSLVCFMYLFYSSPLIDCVLPARKLLYMCVPSAYVWVTREEAEWGDNAYHSCVSRGKWVIVLFLPPWLWWPEDSSSTTPSQWSSPGYSCSSVSLPTSAQVRPVTCFYWIEYGKGDEMLLSVIRLYESVAPNFLEDSLFDEASGHILESPECKELGWPLANSE